MPQCLMHNMQVNSKYVAEEVLEVYIAGLESSLF